MRELSGGHDVLEIGVEGFVIKDQVGEDNGM